MIEEPANHHQNSELLQGRWVDDKIDLTFLSYIYIRHPSRLVKVGLKTGKQTDPRVVTCRLAGSGRAIQREGCGEEGDAGDDATRDERRDS